MNQNKFIGKLIQKEQEEKMNEQTNADEDDQQEELSLSGDSEEEDLFGPEEEEKEPEGASCVSCPIQMWQNAKIQKLNALIDNTAKNLALFKNEDTIRTNPFKGNTKIVILDLEQMKKESKMAAR